MPLVRKVAKQIAEQNHKDERPNPEQVEGGEILKKLAFQQDTSYY